jgi:SpoVK/Ycf46/Vps4 family AAA+-type ATPase
MAKNTNDVRDLTRVHVAQLKEMLAINMAIKQVTFILGPPGCGKTEIVRQVAKEQGSTAVDFILSELLPEDIGGTVVADTKNSQSIRLMPDVVARIHKVRAETGRPVVAFFDELTNAPKSVTAAAFKLLHEGTAGGFAVPEDTMFVAAGNPPEVSSVAEDLPAPLLNRMSIVNFAGPTATEWRDHMLNRGVHPAVMGFVHMNGSYLIEEADFNSGSATPTPRSWAAVSAMLHHLDKLKETDGKPLNVVTRMSSIASRVGSRAAQMMEASLKYADQLQPWSAIKADPENCPVTQEFAPAYIQAIALIAAVGERSKEDAKSAIIYGRRLPREVLAVLALGLSQRPDGAVLRSAMTLSDSTAIAEMASSNRALKLK